MVLIRRPLLGLALGELETFRAVLQILLCMTVVGVRGLALGALLLCVSIVGISFPDGESSTCRRDHMKVANFPPLG